MTKPHDRPTEAPPSASDSRPVLALGEIVNDTYEVRAMLGAGGMGEVYDARDRVLNRRVALKVVHLRVDPEYLLREGARSRPFITAASSPCIRWGCTAGSRTW